MTIKEEILKVYPNAEIVESNSNYSFVTSEDSEFEYFINKEDKTIVAVLNHDFIKECYKCGFIGNMFLEYKEGMNSTNIPLVERYKSFVGKAKVNPVDEFDFETGLKLARSRALKKYYTYLHKTSQNIFTYLYKCFSMEHNLVNHYSEMIEKYQ